MTTLNRLLNADNECVGYFTDDAAGRAAMQAARAEWDSWVHQHGNRFCLPDCKVPRCSAHLCRTIATPIKPLELEDVEPGDGDRVESSFATTPKGALRTETNIGWRTSEWYSRGAASVDVHRYEINRYRRPGKSNRSVDLGGPEQAAGVLYVLTIKAPK